MSQTTLYDPATLKPAPFMAIDSHLLSILRCPHSKAALALRDGCLKAEDSGRSYRISPSGIPLFAEDCDAGSSSAVQQAHFDRIYKAYLEALNDPQSKEYSAYLDRELQEAAAGPGGNLGVLLELCCGHGEGLTLFADRAERALGVDISLSMLESTRLENGPMAEAFLLQGDVNRLPLADSSVDTVVTIGGIHHIPDRVRMFSEVRRVLKPGGRFIWREPANDFWLWRGLRAIVYRLSPQLDGDNETPLCRKTTQAELEQAGLRLAAWRTVGFLGFILFMNGDVLHVNRCFRFVPGIRRLVRAVIRLDRWLTALPLLQDLGLLVVGCAEKTRADGRP
jgi:ubiquinone/menaquinone biosynthesis C-methylase UbiE